MGQSWAISRLAGRPPGAECGTCSRHLVGARLPVTPWHRARVGCPSRAATPCADTPAASRCVANAWRQSWKRGRGSAMAATLERAVRRHWAEVSAARPRKHQRAVRRAAAGEAVAAQPGNVLGRQRHGHGARRGSSAPGPGRCRPARARGRGCPRAAAPGDRGEVASVRSTGSADLEGDHVSGPTRSNMSEP
jgi:hypothetical protein